MDKNRFKIGKKYISYTNIPDTKQRIAEANKEGMNTYICVSNPRTVTYATKHKDYRVVMENSFMYLPDACDSVFINNLSFYSKADHLNKEGQKAFTSLLKEQYSN